MIDLSITGETATALVAKSINCPHGSYPSGIDASGNILSCIALGISETPAYGQEWCVIAACLAMLVLCGAWVLARTSRQARSLFNKADATAACKKAN